MPSRATIGTLISAGAHDIHVREDGEHDAPPIMLRHAAGAVALVLLARTAGSPHHSMPFDWAGQIAAVAGMGGLTYGAIETGAAGITAPRVLAAFAVAVVSLAVFGVLQAQGRHPMMPLSLFRSRTVSVAVVTGFAFMVGYYGLPFVMSLYLQQLRGLSALGTGVAFLPMMLTGAILTPFAARLAERLGARTLITTGLVCMTGGLAVIGLMPGAAPVVVLSVLMILVGLAGPFVMPPVMALLLHAVYLASRHSYSALRREEAAPSCSAL